MKITKEKLVQIIKEEVINETGGVAGNFGGAVNQLSAQRADGNDSPDHDLYGPQQNAEDNFIGILTAIGQMLDVWEQKEYPTDEARYTSYFQDLQGLLEQFDPCAHHGQKCDEVHPNQSHEECVEVTINDALYEAVQKRLKEVAYEPGRAVSGIKASMHDPVSPERKLKYGEKCPPGYKLGLTDYCEKIGADPMEIDSAISRIEGKQGGGFGGF